MKYASDIYEVVRNKFLSLNQTITNFNVGSRIRSIFEAVALAIEEVWFRIDTMYQGLFLSTAKEDDLDLRALELGIIRRAAQKASGYVTFYGTAATVIPSGTVCSTDPDIDPVSEFLTTEQKTIPAAGYVDAPVEAKVAGKVGNVEKEKVIYLPQSISGVTEIKNLEGISGGDDEEDDESLRRRTVLRWYALSYGGCEEAFRAWALEVDGVADAQLAACYEGPGTVKVYVWSRDESGKLIPASSVLVAAVQAFLDERKPICTKAVVAQPSGLLVDVFVFLKCKTGYTFATVSESVKTAIVQLFNDLDIGEDLIVSQLLGTIMAIEGVLDAKMGVPKENVECAGTDTIMLGRYSVQPMEWEQKYVVW